MLACASAGARRDEALLQGDGGGFHAAKVAQEMQGSDPLPSLMCSTFPRELTTSKAGYELADWIRTWKR